MSIRAIPTTYRATRFRSRLEADWAASLDAYNVSWQYEPEGYQLPSGTLYLPDFYLPDIRTWLEVKGPHWERLDKAEEFRWAVACSPECPKPCLDEDHTTYRHPWRMVVVGGPARGGDELFAQVPGVSTMPSRCEECGKWQWNTHWRADVKCRACGAIDSLDELASAGHRGDPFKLGMRFHRGPRLGVAR